jgi:hypothetical protein
VDSACWGSTSTPRTSLLLRLIALQAVELFLVRCFVRLVRTQIDGRLNGEGDLSASW